MILTNSTLTPAERFMEIIKANFEAKGYVYKKGERAFIKVTELGFVKIDVHFKTHFSIVLVSIYWGSSFTKFEKLFALLEGNKNKHKPEITFSANTANVILKNEEATNILCPLFNPDTQLYDDTSLNIAAQKIMRLHETYTVPFFSKYISYKSIYDKIIQFPLQQANDLLIRYDRLACLGLVLAKYFDNPDFKKLSASYCESAEHLNTMIKDKTKTIIDKTLEFLNNNNIRDHI